METGERGLGILDKTVMVKEQQLAFSEFADHTPEYAGPTAVLFCIWV